jgi:hypothetical protein
MINGFRQRGTLVEAPPKDPDANLDYTIDWTQWLGTDTIAASLWEVSSTDLIIGNDSKTNTATTVWLSGGLAGQVYKVTNRITTAEGRIQDQSFRLNVKDN